MDLSLREAAVLLGRSARTLRDQLARGEIAGEKRGGKWRVEQRALPMTESQREALQARASQVRSTVEAALPSRTADRRDRKRRSLADVDVFRATAATLAAMQEETAKIAASPGSLALPPPPAAVEHLRESLEHLAVGINDYEPCRKVASFRRARASVSRSCAALLTAQTLPLIEPSASWLARLEFEVLPSIAGLLRWTERLRRRGR